MIKKKNGGIESARAKSKEEEKTTGKTKDGKNTSGKPLIIELDSKQVQETIT